MPRTFLSKNRYFSKTAEDLSERWRLSIYQAALTLKATTQNLTRSAIMPLTQRYRAYRIFDVRRIHGTKSTDTKDARYQSIHDKKYCQVFGNKKFFVKSYPIKKKYDFRLGLYKFVKDYRAPNKMNYNGAQERIRKREQTQHRTTGRPRGKR